MENTIMDKIKFFEDAKQLTGRPDVPDFLNAPEDMRAYFEAQYKMMVIAEGLNEGWAPNWDDDNEPKYFAWFIKKSSGFAFGGTDYGYSIAAAGYGSRLCFKTRALARYAGEQFIDIWNDILLK